MHLGFVSSYTLIFMLFSSNEDSACFINEPNKLFHTLVEFH